MIADWININDDKPKEFEEVIVASSEGHVKAAIYLGNGKFTTYLNITHWTHMPEFTKAEGVVEEPVKKRGRPKKND